MQYTTEEFHQPRAVAPPSSPAQQSNISTDEQRSIKQQQAFAIRPYHTPPVGAFRPTKLMQPNLPTRPETSPNISSVVPSKDFFFDIKDLAVRIHNTEMQEVKRARLLKEKQIRKEFGSLLTVPEPNIETMSVDSNESALSKLDMSFEPPVFFGRNEKNYLGY